MAYGRGHAKGTRQQRTPRPSTIARDQAKAEALAQRVQELARQMMAQWQGKGAE